MVKPHPLLCWTGACITGDNQLYMAGGAIRKINYRGPFSAEGVSSNLFMYDKTFGSWQVKAKMTNGRSQFALAVVDGWEAFRVLLCNLKWKSAWIDLWFSGPRPEKTSDLWVRSTYCFKTTFLAPCCLNLLDVQQTVGVPPYVLHRTQRFQDTIKTDHISYICFFFLNCRCIVAVGGQNESSIIDSVEVYDPSTNSWSLRTPLPQPVRCMTSVAHKGSLYVFGGESEKEITRAAYRWVKSTPKKLMRFMFGKSVTTDHKKANKWCVQHRFLHPETRIISPLPLRVSATSHLKCSGTLQREQKRPHYITVSLKQNKANFFCCFFARSPFKSTSWRFQIRPGRRQLVGIASYEHGKSLGGQCGLQKQHLCHRRQFFHQHQVEKRTAAGTLRRHRGDFRPSGGNVENGTRATQRPVRCRQVSRVLDGIRGPFQMGHQNGKNRTTACVG